MDRPIWRICRPPLLPLPSLTAASGPVKHSNRWTANTSLLVWAHGRYVALTGILTAIQQCDHHEAQDTAQEVSSPVGRVDVAHH
jgi:hypothetical protein